MVASDDKFWEFIERLRANEDQAWSQLYIIVLAQTRKYRSVGILSPEDLAQEICIKIQAAIVRYQPGKGRGTIEQNFRRWVYISVKRAYLTILKHEDRSVSLSTLLQGLHRPEAAAADTAHDDAILLDTLSRETMAYSASADDPEEQQALKEIRDLIFELNPERKRIAIYYHYIEGFTYEETAKLLNMHGDAMNSLLDRAKKELREIAEQRGIDANYLQLWEKGRGHRSPPTRRIDSEEETHGGDDDGEAIDQEN